MNKITDKVNTMDRKINGLEARMANIKQSRDYEVCRLAANQAN